MRGFRILGFYLLVGASGCLLKNTRTKSKKTLDCHVAIVGGGISGLYMAYGILKDNSNSKVCIFEKESILGGRVRDHRFREAPDVNVGLGAWRIDKKQPIMLNLLKQLNIPTKEWKFDKTKLYKSRGITANNTEDIKEGYPAFKADPKFGNMTKSELWSYLLKPENVAQAKNYATLYTYVSNMISSEGANFLADTTIHKSHFEELASPFFSFEYIRVLSSLSLKFVKPHGGMSTIIKRLNEEVKALGGNIYTSTVVRYITKEDSIYVLLTPDLRIKAKKLVVATPPGQFGKLKGTIAKKIQSTPQFKSILPIPAFRGIAVYKTAWWEKINGKVFLKDGQHFQSHDNCLGTNTAERGYGPNGEGVIYTVYNDGACARRWKEIADLKTKNYLEFEVHKALEAKFEVKIPKPIATRYQYWDSAWHLQKSGTPFTMRDIRNWAKRPFPDEDIFLVGTSYNPIRAFCEGAVSSCRHALKEVWKNKKGAENSDYRKYHKTTVTNIVKFLKSIISKSKKSGADDH